MGEEEEREEREREEREEREREEREREEQGDDAELEAIRADPGATRKAINALHGEAADYRKRLRKAEAELERVKTEGLSEQERAVAEAELKGRQAAEAEHGRRLLEAQLRAAAAGKLQDPGDAIRYLDVEAMLEADADERELDKAIEKLVDEKPYLAAAKADDGRRVGVQSQGARTAPGSTKATDSDGSAWLRKAARTKG